MRESPKSLVRGALLALVVVLAVGVLWMVGDGDAPDSGSSTSTTITSSTSTGLGSTSSRAGSTSTGSGTEATPSTGEDATFEAPTLPANRAAIENDAFVGVPFRAPPDDAVGEIVSVTGGRLVDDSTERAEDLGVLGFPCHGPTEDPPRTLRHVSIDFDAGSVTIYVADGVYMGYVVSGENTRYTTADGVGLGSTEQDLIRAYGDQLTLEPGLSAETWGFLPIMGAAGPTRFDITATGRVERITVGGRCAD